MTPTQYKAALKKLGFSQHGAAPYLGVAKRTSQAYALGETSIPEAVVILLRLLVSGKITTSDIEAARRG